MCTRFKLNLSKQYDEIIDGEHIAGDFDGVERLLNGKTKVYEFKGWNWDELNIDFQKTLEKQINKLKKLKANEKIADYEF